MKISVIISEQTNRISCYLNPTLAYSAKVKILPKITPHGSTMPKVPVKVSTTISVATPKFKLEFLHIGGGLRYGNIG